MLSLLTYLNAFIFLLAKYLDSYCDSHNMLYKNLGVAAVGKVAVEPTGNTFFVGSCMQARLRVQYNAK